MTSLSPSSSAVLVLQDGRVFRGAAFGRRGRTTGEVVFNTSLTGYQEILGDPSYCGQLVTFTCTQIGNVGVNPNDEESDRLWAAGMIIRELSPVYSNYRAERSLDEDLAARGIVGISEIDTRALVRHIRDRGAQMAILSSDPQDIDNIEGLKREVKALGSMEGRDLASVVSCKEPYSWTKTLFDLDHNRPGTPPPLRFKIVAYDFGIKHEILRHLVARGCEVRVVPSSTPASEVLALAPDGVFLANGPGDPAAVTGAIGEIGKLIGQVPMFGICLGHQLIALALGGSTYKLKFGHRGGNHPVADKWTGKVEISTQNHGFAVRAEGLPAGVEITHLNLNDHTVEGLAWPEKKVFSVQYHPEASPGPHDSHYLFDRFIEWMEKYRL